MFTKVGGVVTAHSYVARSFPVSFWKPLSPVSEVTPKTGVFLSRSLVLRLVLRRLTGVIFNSWG